MMIFMPAPLASNAVLENYSDSVALTIEIS